MSSRWIGNSSVRQRYAILAEVGAIAIWVLIVGHGYLDMNPQMWPIGGEFGHQIQSNYLWTQFEKCGWCAVWFGSEQGGFPAFVSIPTSMLHPIVALATLTLGVVNGVKVTLLVSLWLAGVAQWWIARELKLGPLPRLWSAGIAVAGGNLACRMETGYYQQILAIASAGLLVAALIHLFHGGGRQGAVLLGICAASFLLADQGYMQIGMIQILCAGVFLFFDDRKHVSTFCKELIISLCLGALLAAPLLVPLLHFSPNFTKGLGPSFEAAQPLAYLPLNLVIDDLKYYQTDILGKFPFPQLYSLYIGWIPILLAVLGLGKIRKEDRWIGWFFGVAIFLAFFAASAMLDKLLVKFWPATANSPFVGGLRFPSYIAALAIPFILGLSAYGLEYLMSKKWPTISFSRSEASPLQLQLSSKWLVLIPLLYSLQAVYAFSTHWYTMVPLAPEVNDVLVALKTDSLQWVEPPFGVDYFVEPAVAMGLKLSPGFMDVIWNGRDLPEPVLYASYSGEPPGATAEVESVDGVAIYATDPGNTYAQITNGQTQEPCQALGSGGQITVQCAATQAGRLIVKENMWAGWYAWTDGRPVSLYQNQWLEVDAPAGTHTFTFRYLPWDVPLGLALFVMGIGACIWLWFRFPQQRTA
ncbi:MAG TPA: hypothetical protein VLX61_14470 [Anaerolineales bacterium]|nr:hypothetical protein [Anaerolineales bacterium]